MSTPWWYENVAWAVQPGARRRADEAGARVGEDAADRVLLVEGLERPGVTAGRRGGLETLGPGSDRGGAGRTGDDDEDEKHDAAALGAATDGVCELVAMRPRVGGGPNGSLRWSQRLANGLPLIRRSHGRQTSWSA